MIEIKCSDLGFDCSWNYRDNAEYVLLDVVGMHLRECHHVTEVDLDLLGRIRTSFAYPTPGDAAKQADVIMHKYNCEGEPECSVRYRDAMGELVESAPLAKKAA